MIALFSTLFFILSFLAAQEKVDMSMMQKIRDEEKNNSQVALISYHLTDLNGPRLTNSPGYHSALAYVIAFCKQWGLANAGPEAWGEFGKGWSNQVATLEMNVPYYENMIAYAVPWSKGKRKAINAEVFMLDNLDSATIDKAGDSIKGKIIMTKPSSMKIPGAFIAYATRYGDSSLDNIPDKYMLTREQLDLFMPFIKKNYYTKLYLEKKGAAGLIQSRNSSIDGTVFVDGGSGFASGYQATLPEMNITAEDYLKLTRLLEDKQKVQLRMALRSTFYDNDLTGYNFIAEIPGTDPKLKSQVVMLGGHLDSWAGGTGATDNGAGCIATLEAIRILKALGIQPRRTIRIALWGGEEQGLYGSFGYVKKHFGNPADMKLKPEQQNISAYYNLDNGSGKIRGIFAQSNESVRDIFKAWLAPFADMGAAGGVTLSNTGSTDHLSFDAVGIPGFQFIQDPLEYETRTHHSNMDTYDHLSIPDLQQAAVIIAAFVYNTAMRDEMLPRKPLPKPEKFVFDLDFPL
ncbi:MAG: M20/M25/M40 family metallo-hydrolase [Bacteroidetes bacterium]|nr:M20/M25/M40 family metallo-hydrolase [Bacteroidota bacterium]